jgi:CheY-like chemotaxis protein
MDADVHRAHRRNPVAVICCPEPVAGMTRAEDSASARATLPSDPIHIPLLVWKTPMAVDMKPVRALIADESPALRRWYAAALQRLATHVDECDTGWDLLFRLAEDRACDLVVASRTLPGLSGAQVLAMLRAANAHVPFVLVAPFCDRGVRSLVGKLPSAALVEDSLDAVRLAEAAEALVTSSPPSPPQAQHAEKVRRAVALCARVPGLRPRRALG